MEEVILVDRLDKEVGVMEKMKAHREGILHRAFSIFAFNKSGELLLQRRALGKYHSPGLWTNTCCSHPRPGESLDDAAHRRLREEMGFDCPLFHAFSFVYRRVLDKGMIEHELDHVLIGYYDEGVTYNKEEVHEVGYRSVEAIRSAIQNQPDQFTEWFKICFEDVDKFLNRSVVKSIAS